MQPFDKPIGFFVFDYAWVFFILATILNAIIIKVRSTSIVRQHLELQIGYDQLFKAYLLYINIPWVIMGIGMIFGWVPSTFSYFTPRHGNLFVIAFHVSVVILWLFSIWWLYFKGGAEFLVTHRGVFNRDIRSPFLLKILYGFSLLGGIAAEIVMWSW